MAAQAIQHFRLRELQPLLQAVTSKPRTGAPKIPNPFLSHKNPETGRWAPSKYSLRQQADLVKKARQSNLLHLLPPGPKLSLLELQKARQQASASSTSEAADAPETQPLTEDVDWVGEFKEKVVPGAEFGNRLYAGKRRMFKGHKWERTKEKREQKRKVLLASMPQRIQRFKMVYKKKRPNPLSVPLASKAGKLPF
ncbi:54S ribosomal protein L25, mitochondrial [Steccherinum ochraceum]|uniref:54S ribosomal protein L25, mitochondrial n=1 Tax=Steccherinum ochraceum TaxID=92696 RepID=A0A4R0RKH9_9APHY|nr:54S ribosomal protein L25, mitochondrial [Steccherinum ochraceum]